MTHPSSTIKSFVRRQGRMTTSQKQTWTTLSDYDFCQSPDRVAQTIAQCQKPVILDVGFGMGDSLLALAQQFPESLIVGVEVYPAGIARAAKHILDHDFRHVILVQHDVMPVLAVLPASVLSVVQILYPDPGPKKRHHKRRLIQENMLRQVAKVLKPDGSLNIITDHDDYHDHIAMCLQNTEFVDVICSDVFQKYYHQLATKYQKRAVRLGHSVHRFYTRPSQATYCASVSE